MQRQTAEAHGIDILDVKNKIDKVIDDLSTKKGNLANVAKTLLDLQSNMHNAVEN